MDIDRLRMASVVEQLDPLIKQMGKSCTKDTALRIKEILPSVDPYALQKLHPYILVPILGEISTSSLNKEVKTVLLDAVYAILMRVRLNSVSVVKNVLTMLMMEIFDKDSPNMIKNVPEEMKLGVVNCAFATIKNMPDDVQDQFYQKESIPEICQIAYTCLELAVSEKLRSLRVRAMEVVLALQQVPLDGPDRRSPLERQAVADVFQFILPGACSKLVSIISGDITQGSKVLSTAIFTVSSMIALVMEDYMSIENDDTQKMIAALVQMSGKSAFQSKPTENLKEPISRDASGAKKIIESSKGRTKEWREKIISNLLPYLPKISAHRDHSDAKVCKVVIRSCSLLLLRSPISLRDGLASLLDAIVSLSVHDDDEVREESLTSIKELTEYFSEQNGYDFIQLAEENFYLLLTKLPRLVQEEGGARGASAVALLSGYVRLLQPSMRNVLSSSAHLQRLTLSLLHVITLECSSVNVSKEHSMRELVPERCEDLNLPWVVLRFSSDRAVLSNVQLLCDIMAEKSMGVFDFFGSQLMETLNSVPHFRKESILLLNLFLLSTSKVKNDYAHELASSLLEVYVAPEMWPTKENSKSVTTVVKAQHELVTICLLTEGIGCCIHALGKGRAQTHLLRILYPLLEQAGSANGCISLAGRRALTRVAMSCGYISDLVALISNNMDYLSHSMSVRLRRTDTQMGVFDALSLILRHSSPEIALGLSNIVVNVLQQSSDITQRKSNEAHLRVFLTFAQGVCQWLKPKRDIQIDTQLGSDEIDLSEDVVSNPVLLTSSGDWTAAEKLKSYMATLNPSLLFENEEEQVRDPTEELPQEMQPHLIAEEINKDENMEDNAEKKEDVPELAKLLELVLKRCLHFLPSLVEEHQFLAIRTLDLGLQALEPFTETLLPLVHLIWSPLVGRFNANQSPLIIRTAFQLLQTMARTAKDFLMSRTIKEVIPLLIQFLKNAEAESHLKDRASVYRFSQRYKTQLTLLSKLGPLVCHLQLRGQDFYGLLIITLPYLSCYQPQPLQAAAVSLIQSLHSLDADAVWWALVSWWTPPHLADSLGLPIPSSHQDCEANIRLMLDMPSLKGSGEGKLEIQM